jgi:hypothetical protein
MLTMMQKGSVSTAGEMDLHGRFWRNHGFFTLQAAALSAGFDLFRRCRRALFAAAAEAALLNPDYTHRNSQV